MNSTYTVIFKDKSNFSGGTYIDSKWLQIPDKPIKRIIYNLPDGNNLILNNYNQYFHMIEACQDINGPKAGLVRLEYAIIMGRKDNKVDVYKISLINRGNFFPGEILKLQYDWDSDYIRKLNKDGWTTKQ